MGGNKTPWLDTASVVPEYHSHLLAGGQPKSGLVEAARRITVEEAALLQTFSSNMVFEGKRSSRYRQVGNAVPPLLAEALGRALLGQLDASGLAEVEASDLGHQAVDEFHVGLKVAQMAMEITDRSRPSASRAARQ
jgi:DNA (cytosine-5)-methyltransferase 1